MWGSSVRVLKGGRVNPERKRDMEKDSFSFFLTSVKVFSAGDRRKIPWGRRRGEGGRKGRGGKKGKGREERRR